MSFIISSKLYMHSIPCRARTVFVVSQLLFESDSNDARRRTYLGSFLTRSRHIKLEHVGCARANTHTLPHYDKWHIGPVFVQQSSELISTNCSMIFGEIRCATCPACLVTPCLRISWVGYVRILYTRLNSNRNDNQSILLTVCNCFSINIFYKHNQMVRTRFYLKRSCIQIFVDKCKCGWMDKLKKWPS